MHFNRRYILIIILLLAVLSVFLPITVRYNFYTSAKIYPLKEWKLTRGETEGFWSQSYNYETNALSDFKNYRFERGDISELKMKHNIQTDTLINKDDTVAFIDSWFIENEIVRLKDLRDIEQANLSVVSTGEKQPMIDHAQRKYDYAVEQLELQKKNYERQHKLFLDSVITLSEEEAYENALKLAQINTEVASNELIALKTGEKDQVQGLTEQKILSYDKEIERLEEQKKQYTILSPLGGLLSYDPSLGGILKVSDISYLVLKIPVPYRNSVYLSKLHSVRFSTPDDKITIGATFKGFDENVSMIQNQQVVIAKAVTNEFSPGIYPGMVVKCRIYCDRVSLFEYIKRNFMLSF
jgi:hypothetical protein